MGRRTKARECAFQMLYQWAITGGAMENVVDSFWRVRRSTSATRAMADRLATGAHSRVEEIDSAIEEAASNWRLERIAPVDRTILRLGTWELTGEPGTPAAVVLDEAVELAKRFGEADSPAFVNGVLDAIRRRVRGGSTGGRGQEGTRRGTSADQQHDGEAAPPVPGWPAESAQRLEKAKALRELGVTVYPTRFERTHRLGEIIDAYDGKTIEELEELGVDVRIAGRVVTKRGHGKASFATLSDGQSRLQTYVRLDGVGEKGYRIFDLLDLGDFVGVAGKVMRTRKGEISVEAKEITFLGKALLPPPEKWHGLADVEIRYRQRYLDLMANPGVRRTFLTRSAVVSAIRRFMDERGYLEVETPMMQPVAGGAMARPFVTHHNALDVDLFLRIAPELYLKRLVAGGLERVYEINRSFRNEGISTMHNPEFTMLEFYTAWFGCEDVMDTTEALVGAAARAAGTSPFTYGGREVSFGVPFPRLAMKDAVAERLDAESVPGFSRKALDEPKRLVTALRTPEFGALAERLGLDADAGLALSHGKRVAWLFEELVEASLWNPTFVTDYPVEVSPLAKARPDDPTVTQRFELYVAGMEVANGFSELNDPLEQRQRFLDQLRERERGDLEAHQMDEDYIRVLGHGLPPTGGCGVGIDRLAMILTDSPSIRDVIFFPQMRPEGGRAGGIGSEAGTQGGTE